MRKIEDIPKDEWEDNLELWRTGMRITLPHIYVLPSQAKIAHENFVDRLKRQKWGFILVRGENRAGKSAYIKFIENQANEEGYSIAHIEVNGTEITQYGPAPYLNLQLINNLRLPNGKLFRYEIETDEEFRTRLHTIIDSNFPSLEFWNPGLANAFLWATDNSDLVKRGLAKSWLRGENQYVTDLRTLQIYDRTMRSLLNVPTAKLLYFLRELCHYLGSKGFLSTVDEIEKVGEVTPVKGKESLSILRDLINILVNDDSLPTRRGIADGIFVVYAISTFFLGYSGIIEVEGVDFRGLADKYGKPKVSLGDVPRLHTVLTRNPSTIVTDFYNLDDIRKIADKVILCYSKAKNTSVSISPEDLAQKAYDRTGFFKAGENIQEMIKILDESA
jgi:hypothetical protein